jgi:hypothetical protein
MKWDLKTVLVTLVCVTIVLGLVAFYVVFLSDGGTYVVSSNSGPNAAIFSLSTTSIASAMPSSTASSSLAIASSSTSAASSTASTTLDAASPDMTPISWQEGNEAMSVTGATLVGTQLTLDMQVQMGSASECVPMNMRLIADEQGDLSPPITSQFMFPDTGTCTGTPGEIYTDQQVVFSVADPTAFPFVLTTGGIANMFFEVDQNQDGTLSVQLPPSAG